MKKCNSAARTAAAASRTIPVTVTRAKLCLTCARRKLAGDPMKACGDCILLNTDPLARVRANASKPIISGTPEAQAMFVLGEVLGAPARATHKRIGLD